MAARIAEMCVKDYPALEDSVDRLRLGNVCILNAVHLQSHCNGRLADGRVEELEETYIAIRFLAKLPRTREGIFPIFERATERQG
jgi:hypothetical protein